MVYDFLIFSKHDTVVRINISYLTFSFKRIDVEHIALIVAIGICASFGVISNLTWSAKPETTSEKKRARFVSTI